MTRSVLPVSRARTDATHAAFRLPSNAPVSAVRVESLAFPYRPRADALRRAWRMHRCGVTHAARATRAALGLALATYGLAAHAEVTLYGIVDEGISYTSNQGGGHAYQMRSGLLDGSRFGLRGTEDLGGGYRTFFTLENGFDTGTGNFQQNGRMFGRQAFVGIDTPSYGKVSFGTQYDMNVEYLFPVMALGRVVATIYDLDNEGANRRSPNAIKYMSPTLGGFSFGALYSLGGQAGDFSRNSVWSIGAGYKIGIVQLAAAATTVRNPYQTWYDGTGAASIATIGTYLAQASTLETRGAGARVAVGQWSGKIGMTHNVFDNGLAGQNVRFDSYMVQTDYRIQPNWSVSGAFELTRGKVNATGQKPAYRQVDLFTLYSLSKRTDVYFLLAYQRAGGDAKVAQIGLIPASSTRSQLLAHAAFRVKF
ncbi:porin [Chitinasiproducens palmae]|uniref:Outer membrane protein (Porin) n=1 Tax=Chitinasiproducens palmae TaxID=1770053 RepID=A0A1H2PQ22_9BURK|nr:porin [Chitinasiproducens palmae]SDV48870.1 Outer membrane protein (porin) [Chitinasiproducens palmae]